MRNPPAQKSWRTRSCKKPSNSHWQQHAQAQIALLFGPIAWECVMCSHANSVTRSRNGSWRTSQTLNSSSRTSRPWRTKRWWTRWTVLGAGLLRLTSLLPASFANRCQRRTTTGIPTATAFKRHQEKLVKHSQEWWATSRNTSPWWWSQKMWGASPCETKEAHQWSDRWLTRWGKPGTPSAGRFWTRSTSWSHRTGLVAGWSAWGRTSLPKRMWTIVSRWLKTWRSRSGPSKSISNSSRWANWECQRGGCPTSGRSGLSRQASWRSRAARLPGTMCWLT